MLIYKHKEYDKARVKKIITERHPDIDIVAAFERVDYDLEKFFLTEAKDYMEDVLITLLIEFKTDLSDYFFDLANGYWDIPKGTPHTIGYAQMCKYLFLCCETDEDIWDLLYYFCPVQIALDIYRCYTGENYIEGFDLYLKNPAKADRMFEYFRNKKFDYVPAYKYTILPDIQ